MPIDRRDFLRLGGAAAFGKAGAGIAHAAAPLSLGRRYRLAARMALNSRLCAISIVSRS